MTDQALAKKLDWLLDNLQCTANELRNRGWSVKICSDDISYFGGEKGVVTQEVYFAKITKTTVEVLSRN